MPRPDKAHARGLGYMMPIRTRTMMRCAASTMLKPATLAPVTDAPLSTRWPQIGRMPAAMLAAPRPSHSRLDVIPTTCPFRLVSRTGRPALASVRTLVCLLQSCLSSTHPAPKVSSFTSRVGTSEHHSRSQSGPEPRPVLAAPPPARPSQPRRPRLYKDPQRRRQRYRRFGRDKGSPDDGGNGRHSQAQHDTSRNFDVPLTSLSLRAFPRTP